MIYNSSATLPSMSTVSTPSTVLIPGASISGTDGTALVARLKLNETININFNGNFINNDMNLFLIDFPL